VEVGADPMIEDLKRKLTRANASLRRAQRRHKDDVSRLLTRLARFQETQESLGKELESSQTQVADWRNAALELDAQIKTICRSRRPLSVVSLTERRLTSDSSFQIEMIPPLVRREGRPGATALSDIHIWMFYTLWDATMVNRSVIVFTT
jgi:hypothetical protein